MWECFVIIIFGLLSVQSDNKQIRLAREEKTNFFSFFPPKSRAGSICLGMSQQD